MNKLKFNVMNRLPIITAGFLLLINVIVLAGVAYNRSGEPVASLQLTERELLLPRYHSSAKKENSGLALTLSWNIAPAYPFDNKYRRYALTNYGTPNWLSNEKLKELGFDVGKTSTDIRDSLTGYKKLESEEVIIVLEYNGDAFHAYVKKVEADVQHFRNDVKNNPNDSDLAKRLASNEKSLKELKNTESRLIAIDAGLDLKTLKQKYPDSSKYLMLRGEVRRYWSNKQLTAGIKQLFINKVHVSLPYLKEISELTMLGDSRNIVKPRYRVGLDLGKRLEPWVGGVSGL